MTISPSSSTQSVAANLDEHILVVKRDDFFSLESAWQGLKKVDFDPYLQLINEKKEFRPRSLMEVDPTYKQIIPYLVFCHDHRYFLMQRHANASESRLQSKFSLGIGGHIRQEDLTTNSIIEWSDREFHEEVLYNDPIKIKPLGILNDDSTPVGNVHVGFVFLLEGSTPNISIKSELKSGRLISLEEGKEYFNRMESWSQLVFESLW